MYGESTTFLNTQFLFYIVVAGIAVVSCVELFFNNNLLIGLKLFLDKVRTLWARISSGLSDEED